ncbi:hypothetical protein MY9_3298 [Bacillus sp. JS]|nr:hypothetical protein MY9_3298 [Bacillus sp. JS]
MKPYIAFIFGSLSLADCCRSVIVTFGAGISIFIKISSRPLFH